jgi:peroxiredoxin Q/BCP
MKLAPLGLFALLSLDACNRGSAPAPDPGSSGAAPGATAPAAAAGGLAPVGSPAPGFAATSHDGRSVSLDGLRGKAVVLYFYPKDDTPGCTAEAEGFRDRHGDFEKAQAVVVGVSTDGNESHGAFAKKYGLPFVLLPDPDQKIARAYGVPVRLGYAKRVTFVIDRQGKIARVFGDVKPRGHAEEVLRALAEIGAG